MLTQLASSNRYTVASADPEDIITKLCSLPKQADDRVEVDKKARSLTRSLTRSAASSPLVQLLATHRKRRWDLTPAWNAPQICMPKPNLSYLCMCAYWLLAAAET